MSIDRHLQRFGQAMDEHMMEEILAEQLHKPRSVFYPGNRIKMNVMPMFVAIFVPWAFYCALYVLFASSLYYSAAWAVYALAILLILVWAVMAYQAWKARKIDPEPTWFTYLAFAVLVAIIAGILLGKVNYSSYSETYYSTSDLKVVGKVDPATARGEDVMDAGIIYFTDNASIDESKAWHFRHGTNYCVAPIVSNSTMYTFDFWAIGTDCCSSSSADFYCGDYDDPDAQAGLRELDDQDWYTLAVQQAKTLYKLEVSHPIFVTWLEDPLASSSSEKSAGSKQAVGSIVFAFVICFFCTMMATAGFAWIGRTSEAANADIVSDPDFKKGKAYQHGIRRGGHDPRMRMYTQP